MCCVTDSAKLTGNPVMRQFTGTGITWNYQIIGKVNDLVPLRECRNNLQSSTTAPRLIRNKINVRQRLLNRFKIDISPLIKE